MRAASEWQATNVNRSVSIGLASEAYFLAVEPMLMPLDGGSTLAPVQMLPLTF